MEQVGARERIVEQADRLFYEKGFDHTSFAHIATAAGLSRGNFYYHFRTKDEILDAVIDLRTTRTLALLQQWEAELENPRDRIIRFLAILTDNGSKIMKHGCPAGTLCLELAKLGHPSAPGATAILSLFSQWLEHQFSTLGARESAGPLANHVLMRSQGIATLAAAFQETAFVEAELADAARWINGQIDTFRKQTGDSACSSSS
ncbi:MAG: TetR/AcrR family transcriptional regulator [Notoacmeibacter sp.]|nr:TetR/AcrR family transcriptional regulator [Notoacmeibacter sp.]MCC0032777.1 TetR/AcrR family transcriptional regulator [Brucellaceae bacterium]